MGTFFAATGSDQSCSLEKLLSTSVKAGQSHASGLCNSLPAVLPLLMLLSLLYSIYICYPQRKLIYQTWVSSILRHGTAK